MSKRYGRQQKRKARFQIALLQAQIEDLQEEVMFWKSAHSEQREQTELIASALRNACPYSAFLPPLAVCQDQYSYNVFPYAVSDWKFRQLSRRRVTAKVDRAGMFEVEKERVLQDVRTTKVLLHHVRVVVDENWERLSRMVHLRLGDAAQVSYAVSLETLEQFEDLPFVQREIAKEIMHTLGRYFQKARTR